MDPARERLLSEIFFTTAAPALVGEVATILAPASIPVMPLKGVLLQRWVYGKTFRSITDVDILVPPDAFPRAREILRRSGFSVTGLGQDVFRRPGFILELDLHRKLSTTLRSRLSPDDMFRRGKPDREMFGAPVVLPSPEDLFAHLLLHLTLHWVNQGVLHHPEDFDLLSEALSLSAERVAGHLRTVGLEPHAHLMLPRLEAEKPGGFAGRLRTLLESSDPAIKIRAAVAARLCATAPPGSLIRRTGGFLLAPSLVEAAGEAVQRRLLKRQRSD